MKKQENEKKTKRIQTPVFFEEEMVKALDDQAAREGIFRGRSIIIRRACAEYLERRQVTVQAQEAA